MCLNDAPRGVAHHAVSCGHIERESVRVNRLRGSELSHFRAAVGSAAQDTGVAETMSRASWRFGSNWPRSIRGRRAATAGWATKMQGAQSRWAFDRSAGAEIPVLADGCNSVVRATSPFAVVKRPQTGEFPSAAIRIGGEAESTCRW